MLVLASAVEITLKQLLTHDNSNRRYIDPRFVGNCRVPLRRSKQCRTGQRLGQELRESLGHRTRIRDIRHDHGFHGSPSDTAGYKFDHGGLVLFYYLPECSSDGPLFISSESSSRKLFS